MEEQLLKQLVKSVAAVQSSNSPAGMDCREEQPLKQYAKLILAVQLSNSPAGMDAREEQPRKHHLISLINSILLNKFEHIFFSLVQFS